MAGVDALDDFLDGLVFDEKVAHFDGGEDLADKVGALDVEAVEPNAVGELVHLLHFQTIPLKNGHAAEMGAILQRKFDLLGAEEALFQIGERAIVENFAVVNNHDPATKLFDVVQIVRGEQDRGAKFAIDGAKELADVILGDNVEAYGGLVEKEKRRIVEERGGKVAAHALAERKFADRRVEIIANPENFVEVVHARVEISLRNIIDPAQEPEGFDDGDVPPKLCALAENNADCFDVLAALAERDEAVDADFAGSWNKDAGKHLDRSRFAGTVGADIADDFAAVDGEADTIDGRYRVVVADEKVLDRTPKALAAAERAEMLRKIMNVNDRGAVG